MDLAIKDRLFVVTGASSGFGLAIAQRLVEEGARVIINARSNDKLEVLLAKYPTQMESVQGDITTDAVIANIFRKIGDRPLDGVVVNAGGPPAMSFMETELPDWDKAYESILRWKVKFTKELLDKLLDQGYGRVLYIESASVKQPIENLVLSNAMRLAVVGFVKTLSQEIADKGITLNILAPGYHDTPAMGRLFDKKASLLGISPLDARKHFEEDIKTGQMGNASDFASLALWFLSPLSGYITGQTVSVDGGMIRGIMG